MKKMITTALFASALFMAPVAQANPDLCSGHTEPNSTLLHQKYITACGGDSGPDYANNANTPDVDTAPERAREPAEVMPPSSTKYVDAGTSDESQDIHDEDGIQGHDNVTKSPLYVPENVT